LPAERMEHENSNVVTEFILAGLTQSQNIQLLVFVLVLIFCLILPGNFLIIFTIRSDPGLTAPLYFLGNLAFLDASYSFIVAPRMLVDFLSEKKVISYRGCIIQPFFLHFLGGGEGLLLVVMAFDRYIAICRPLHYSTVMNPRTLFVGLVVTSCTVGFLHTVSQLAFTLYLPFCGPNVIDSFFCDLPLVIQLACIDIYVLGIFMISTSGVIALISFLLLLTSYIIVLVTIKDLSSTGSSKAFSTYFLVDKFLSLFYTILTLFLNPLIYTLTNQEVKTANNRKLKLESIHLV
uniref:Olfactory receptor n=1 Tax=Balaenoptera musculus TaxID=9771 RepID=A0A8C0CZ31_BALMU